MRTHRSHPLSVAFVVGLLGFVLTACGGPGSTPPGPNPVAATPVLTPTRFVFPIESPTPATTAPATTTTPTP